LEFGNDGEEFGIASKADACVYFNPDKLTLENVFDCEDCPDEDADEDGDGDTCGECGAEDGEPHEGDCPVALAQDLEDGTLTEKDDSYSDALAAYEEQYGKPFVPASEAAE
jgi:hypothetical protein